MKFSSDLQKKTLRQSYSFSELIPPNTLSGELNSSISKYQNVVQLALDALSAFKKRDMRFFDPIAGDCACQIRALFFSSLINDPETDNYISHFKSIFEEHLFFIDDTLKKFPIDKQFSLQEYLSQLGINLEIPEDITVIVLSYIISLIKAAETYISEDGILSYRTQTRISIPEYPLLKRKFIDQIIKHAQQILTKLSVRYIQELNTIDDKNNKNFLDNCFIRYDHLDRSLLPCYFQTEVVVNQLIRSRTPIVLKLDMFIRHETNSYHEFEMIFNYSKEDFDKENSAERNEKKGVFVISAKSVNKNPICPNKLQAELQKHDIKDLILSAVAAHPQYPYGEIWHPADLKYENYARLALDLGTCRTNPSTCLIDHIFCDVLSNSKLHNLSLAASTLKSH